MTPVKFASILEAGYVPTEINQGQDIDKVGWNGLTEAVHLREKPSNSPSS